MAAEGGVGVPGAPRSASHWLRACPTSTEPARVARRSSSVPTLTPRSSRRFPLFLCSRSRREDLLPSIQAISLAAPAPRLALAPSSIYPSAVSLFILLSLVPPSSPLRLFTLTLSLFFFYTRTPRDKCSAILLIAVSRLPSFFLARCAISTAAPLLVIFSRGPSSPDSSTC